MEIVRIRSEEPRDVDAVHECIRVAFIGHPYSDQTEADIVRRLRAADALTVALTAERDGRVVGHIAFSPVRINGEGTGWYGLGPVAVLPEAQGQGIGSALVREGLTRLRALDAKGCVLAGDPAYYERFGFASHASLTLKGVPPEYFLALTLQGDCPAGAVRFHDAFGAGCGA